MASAQVRVADTESAISQEQRAAGCVRVSPTSTVWGDVVSCGAAEVRLIGVGVVSERHLGE